MVIDETDVGAPSALDRLDRIGVAPDTESRRERRARRRNERWERPVVRDWRWAVRVVGRTLIILGLLMFGFAAYQVWGTGIETARAQNRLENQFEEMLADYEASDSATGDVADPGTLPTDGDAGNGPEGPQGRQPEEGSGDQSPDRAPDGQGHADGDTAEPSGRHETVTIGDGPIRRELPPLEAGDPLGRIEIPEIGLDFMVVEGVSASDLRSGIGHFPDSPQPGQLGNSALAGHRTTYGNPLINANQLEPGHRITVTTLAGTFVYNVTESFVVSPSDYWVVDSEDEDVAMLTLVTCDPAWSARNRLIVRAELDPNASDTIFVADPVAEMTDTSTDARPDNDPDSDDPVVRDENDDDNAASGASDRGRDASGDSGSGDSVASDGEIDAFEQGWFSDSSAYSHVALWAAALAAIAAIGYLVSRHFRRYWVGTLSCAAPFLVTLYFFYQNVNRLLPPAL